MTEDVSNALYEAGCSDGTPFSSQGIAAVGFAREAHSLDEAVRSAIADIQTAGLVGLNRSERRERRQRFLRCLRCLLFSSLHFDKSSSLSVLLTRFHAGSRSETICYRRRVDFCSFVGRR